MVGGWVSETIDTGEDVWIQVNNRLDVCGILVERTPEARSVSTGDQIWWMGERAYWTPKNHTFQDRVLNKIGMAGRNIPDRIAHLRHNN